MNTQSQVHAHARTHSLHTKIITLQVHQACFQRFGGIWFLLWEWGRGGAAEVLLGILGRFFWLLVDSAVWGWRSLLYTEPSIADITLSLSHQSLSSGSCCPLNFSLLLNKRSSPEVPSFPLLWSSVVFIGQVSTPPTQRGHMWSAGIEWHHPWLWTLWSGCGVGWGGRGLGEQGWDRINH